MSRARAYHSQGGPYLGGCRSSFNGNHSTITANDNYNRYNNNGNYISNHNNFHDYSRKFKGYNNRNDYVKHEVAPLKRRKFSTSTWADSGGDYQPKAYNNVPSICDNSLVLPDPSRSDANAYTSTSSKRDRSNFEAEDDVDFMSKEEIESCSPSRKDGIDVLHETHLRYSYCAFLQNLGLRLDLPQTTVGTAMILCHRFFVRRSHACHDRFLIATATLFLVAKSEETARSLNDVLRASCEITHKQDLTALSYLLPSDWFEQYRERVIEAEQLILTTLDFELTVQHPYVPLTSILDKLGLSKSILVNLALNLISEGLRSSLWLQFKPHQIAAGAAYLAARHLNMDLASYQHIWMEFQTPPFILEDVAQQLMELF
ncbi:Cyclin-T1-4 like [Actinidia chinensis var. chinensis]|uniref:Cyclin-T1-4 like n=1 Tax=Actinidia chinensis var. chinensis TaxID=1590841 RepID=A0A2R6P539_ACTCC|nr:Cyclin-T1-4 like [Actinidia chinensis var. chinensis]